MTTTEPDQWQTENGDAEYDPAPHGDGPTELAGDQYDDDGAALDSLVQSADRDDDDGPVQASAPLTYTDRSDASRVAPTRLRTETTTLPVDGGPVRVAARNVNRVRLRFAFYGADVNILLSDDQSKTAMRMGSFALLPTATQNVHLDLDEHTGPVYVSAITNGAAPVASVSVVEVTK